MFRLVLPVAAVALALLPASRAADNKPLEPFNGKDLKGWKLKDEKKSKWAAVAVEVCPKNDKDLLEVAPKPGVGAVPLEHQKRWV